MPRFDNKFVYVGRVEQCRCVVAVVTDNHDKFTGESVAAFIADGLIVERLSWDDYKKMADEDTFFNCTHGQLALPL